MLTDNNVLVNNLNEEPVLMCAQRKADKKVSSEEDFIQSNIDSFGNDIGKITNWVTSMYEVRSKFEPDTKEYNTLTYRIQSGEKFQQDAIDKAKGIVSDPMPKYWYDRHTVNKIEDVEERDFQRNIVADKKPYFMRYIYPELMKDYNTFIKNTTKTSLREFMATVPEIKSVPETERSEQQNEFIRRYDVRMPVGVNDCVMNRICRRFEEEFDGCIGRYNTDDTFDYKVLRNDAEYSKTQFYAVKKLYDEYINNVSNYKVFASYEKIDKYNMAIEIDVLEDEFRRECSVICSNEDVLCNIILDICYSRNSTKKFAWAMCGDVIVRNLLSKNGNKIVYPIKDDCGDIEYKGQRFRLISKDVGSDSNGDSIG